MTPPPGYPAELTVRAALDDGTAVLLRPILPDDAPRLERLFDRLSPETRYRRFLVPVPRPRLDLLDQLVVVDYVARLALVAVVDDEVIAVARYDRSPSAPAEAEIALVVEDAWQRRGIGRRLLASLAAAATERGFQAFTGTALGDNRAVVALLGTLGAPVERALVDGTYVLRVPLQRA